MADIWSNVGADIAPRGEDWLFTKGGEIHGPIPKAAVVDKLLKGDLDFKTPVAREGGEFHPISQVAAFSDHIEEVKKAMRRRTARKVRNMLMVAGVIVLAGGAAGGYYLKQEADAAAKQRKADAEAAALAKAEADKKLQKYIEDASGQVALVALVSLGDISEMKVGGTKPKPRTPRGKTPKGPKQPETSADQFTSQCQRGQNEIFGMLRKHLAKINVCVQDEKSRNAGGLPPTLTLSFVVRPTGSIGDVGIEHRHFRTGPMRNCMVKAFQRIRFESKGGTNCPVTIPINIGK